MPLTEQSDRGGGELLDLIYPKALLPAERSRAEAAQAHVALPGPVSIDEDNPLVRRMMEIAQRSCRK